MFAVTPKRDCPHVHGLNFDEFSKKSFSIDAKCEEEGCDATGENWICCFCGSIMCSRYVAGHAAQHTEKNPDHCIAVSFADCSCWCYKCDSYIEDPISIRFVRHVQHVKFGEPEPEVAAAASFVDTRPIKETVVKSQSGVSMKIRDVLPTVREDLRLEDCDMCVVVVYTPINCLRLVHCKKCTVELRCQISSLNIAGSEEITVRYDVPPTNTSLVVENTSPCLVNLSLDPSHVFFSRCETTNSNVAINCVNAAGMVVCGPHSNTVFNAETHQFVTTKL